MEQLTPITPQSQTITVELTIDEFLALRANQTQKKLNTKSGLKGIAEVFRCSKSEAFKIAHADWFQGALVRLNKHLVFDVDKAWQLAREYTDLTAGIEDN